MSNHENHGAGHFSDDRSFCKDRLCTKFAVTKYLRQLQQSLPYLPPVPTGALKSLHANRNYKEMVRLIKRTMNVEVDLRILWVPEGAANERTMKNAPAWVEMPAEMPPYGSSAFRELRLDIFLRKSFLENSTYDQVTITIAHELSHIVLNSGSSWN